MISIPPGMYVGTYLDFCTLSLGTSATCLVNTWVDIIAFAACLVELID